MKSTIEFYQKDLYEALVDFDMATKIAPMEFSYWRGKAGVNYILQNDNHVLMDINKSIAITPLSNNIFCERGKIYFRLSLG